MPSGDRAEVVVLGAGLSGLAAARDLTFAGTDVVVLEASSRPGGRVERATLPDGRSIEMGAEVVGRSHQAYLGLVDELGLEVEAGYAGLPGSPTWDLTGVGAVIAAELPVLNEVERADLDRINAELEALTASVDPDDPLAHPDAERLDHLSVGQWARDISALASTIRVLELRANTINQGATDRISLLGDLRLRAALPDAFDLRVAGGSSAVPIRMAEQLADRVRYRRQVDSVTVDKDSVAVTTTDGTTISASAVICTIPAGPLRAVRVNGLTPERLRSLRRQRHALMAKIVVAYERPFWQDAGASGVASSEGLFGSIWAQQDGILSLMITPEKLAHHLAAPPELHRVEVCQALERMWGPQANADAPLLQRDWCVDPFTLGGVATYAPGDLTALGELHGKHEPPFFVAGSDHWRCGYMEGAVQTGRGAAAAVLDWTA
jgi:monoamine oxidase